MCGEPEEILWKKNLHLMVKHGGGGGGGMHGSVRSGHHFIKGSTNKQVYVNIL
jgi:hypothetical protein